MICHYVELATDSHSIGIGCIRDKARPKSHGGTVMSDAYIQMHGCLLTVPHRSCTHLLGRVSLRSGQDVKEVKGRGSL